MITKWYGGKKAAVSFNFEGNHDGLYDVGAPLLEDKNWRGTFFISTKTAKWDNVISVRKKGHEIGNHSHSNRNLLSLNVDQVDKELLTSTQQIHKYLPNYNILSFSYPFGVGLRPGREYDSIRTVVSKYHICATAPGTTGDYLTVNRYIPYHGYRNRDFHDYYFQLGTKVIKSNLNLQEFTAELDATIEAGDWLPMMYYSIGTSGREHVEKSMFQAMLDSTQTREEDLWVAPFGEVSMYHIMRRNARIEYLQLEGYNWVMYLEDDLDDETYNRPLTMQVVKPIDCNAVKVTQNGKKCEFYQDWAILQFNATPDKGPIHITYKEIKVD
jgi:peptidoglycan/xylan/chitin deacetylase (PgdA/CDA1 family)